MKSLLFIAAFVSCSLANAQVLPASLTKQKVHINQQLISNCDWAEFLSFLAKDPSFSKDYIRSVTPTGWHSKLMVKNGDLAVTGVSWSQANEYCKWKSEINTYLYTHSSGTTYSKMLAENRLSETRIICRLPTEAELSVTEGISTTPKKGVGFRCVYTIQRAG